MIVKDKGDVWGFVVPGTWDLRWENGETAPLATDLIEVDFGKYRGWLLSDIDDIGYLNWMLKDAMDKENSWQEKCARLRLEDINNNI